MTGWRKRQVMDMAREAGMVYREFEDEFANANTDAVDFKTLEAFAALVRADEREECALLCEEERLNAQHYSATTQSNWLAIKIRAK